MVGRALLLLALPFALIPLLVDRSAYAQPKSWIWEGDEPGDKALRIFHFAPRFNLWIANFDRPPRACRTANIPQPGVLELRAEQFQFPDAFCPSEDSSEIAFGSGVELAFRALGPVYLTASVDFVYTAPSSSAIKNQLVLALPFGVMVTWYEWTIRPIAHFEITPVLYITDDSRDYTLGGNGGIAYRILDLGSISLTAGYMWAETMTAWQVQLGLHPIL